MKLLKNPDRQEGSVQHTIRELLQLSHEGRELSPETVKWLKEIAFLSPELLDVLTKLCLKVGLSAKVHFEIEEQSIELCKAYEEASCNTAELEAVVPVSIDELLVTSTASILFSQIPQQGPSITTANKVIL